MKAIVSIIFSVALVGGGAVVGWEARNWHLVIAQWYEKAAAFDFVGDQNMAQIMHEIARQKILMERQQHPPQKIEVDGKSLPSCPPLKPGQACT